MRFLSNRSSGKMGTAIARAAAHRGARVDVVHGPLRSALPLAPGLTAHAVRSARAMNEAVQALLDDGTPTHAIILCAAVADATPAVVSPKKLKKTEGGLASIALTLTTDILASLGARPHRPLLVGFAAETHDVERYAREKLARKGCDLICANDVTKEGSGFDVGTNELTLIRADREPLRLPRLSKDDAADRVIDEVVALLAARGVP